MDIRNIFCIGRNYEEHVKELSNPKPDDPVVFMKPTHAIATADGNICHLPGTVGEVHYEAELVIKLARDFEIGKSADELVDEMAIGLDLTLRQVQQILKEKRYPWLLAKGFRNAAILSRFLPFPGVEKCKEKTFSLLINNEIVQEGSICDMLFDLDEQIHYIGTHFGLKAGDIIYTGTPSGVGPLVDGDQLTLKWGEEVVGTCIVKLG